MKKVLLTLSFLHLSILAFAQPEPTISGDDMLCPEGTGTVTTQEFESYQWYMRYYGSEDTVLIAGETSQTLLMDAYTYSASYLMVEVTEAGQTAMSEEFFVDGWAFAGITVMSEGDFGIGPNGEAVICNGDTLFLTLNMPYNTNITWYDGGSPIANETEATLEVTEAGSYTVSGAPEVCPDFSQTMGIPIDVIIDNCGLGLDEPELSVSLYPNPASDKLFISSTTEAAFSIATISGMILITGGTTGQSIDISSLSPGIYLVNLRSEDRSAVRSIVVE